MIKVLYSILWFSQGTRKFEMVWVRLSRMKKTEYSLVAFLLWMQRGTHVWLNGIYRSRPESRSKSLSPDNGVHLRDIMVMNWDYWTLQQWDLKSRHSLKLKRNWSVVWEMLIECGFFWHQWICDDIKLYWQTLKSSMTYLGLLLCFLQLPLF